MPLSSLALLLMAAAFHATANMLMKQARDKPAFTWWMLGASSLLGLPLLWVVGEPQPIAWIVVLISGVLEAVYFAALGRAYALGDLSQVYPIARGSAPLFITLWSFAFLGERPSPVGLLGILSIVSGLYLINLPSLADWNRPLLGFGHPAARWALTTGVLISVYSTVDKVGVRYFDPLVYLYLILLVGWIVLTPQWLFAERRAALIEEVRPEPVVRLCSTRAAIGWRRWSRVIGIAASALLGCAAYVLVLTALTISPVSYVSPTREVSVVIGTWIGVRFLSERSGAVRLFASALVALGILLIALGG